MANSKTFQCPNCGSPVMASGADKEVQCSYCGSTVIVPEELRDQPPQTSHDYTSSNSSDQEILQTIGTVGKVAAGVTAGVSVMSFILPVVLTCLILGVVGGILYAVFSNINSPSSQGPNLPSIPFIATATPAPTLTPEPSPTPIPTPIPFSKTLFKDNFSNSSSGWDRARNSKYTLEYKNNTYHVVINEQDAGQAIWISNKFKDVSVEVDTQETAGPSDGKIGVSCRNTDDGRMYSFEYSQDGTYGIYKYSSDGTATSLDENQLDPNTITQGGVNHLEGTCVGDVLTLILNGQPLLQVEDSEYTSGGSGLIVRTGSSGEAGIDVSFTNYLVKGP